MLAEVCILFAGVVSRYVLDSPLFWTDELANFLFLWLSMLGMVVALPSDSHKRLTTLANWVPSQWATWFAAVASLVVIAFVLEVLLPAAQYLDQQRYVELISLQISDGYRVVAIVVGISLLAAIISLLRLLGNHDSAQLLAGSSPTVAGIAALLWLCQPLLLHRRGLRQPDRVLRRHRRRLCRHRRADRLRLRHRHHVLSRPDQHPAQVLSIVVNRMDEGMFPPPPAWAGR